MNARRFNNGQVGRQTPGGLRNLQRINTISGTFVSKELMMSAHIRLTNCRLRDGSIIFLLLIPRYLHGICMRSCCSGWLVASVYTQTVQLNVFWLRAYKLHTLICFNYLINNKTSFIYSHKPQKMANVILYPSHTIYVCLFAWYYGFASVRLTDQYLRLQHTGRGVYGKFVEHSNCHCKLECCHQDRAWRCLHQDI